MPQKFNLAVIKMDVPKLKRCSLCGGEAQLFGEGLAKQIFKDGVWDTFFVDFDGYAIHCLDCYNTTLHHSTIYKAADEWNSIND